MESDTYSDYSSSYDEEEYDQLNDCTFGMNALQIDPKGFSFNKAEENYRKEVTGEENVPSFSSSINSIIKNSDNINTEQDTIICNNVSLDQNKKDDTLANDSNEITTYKTSIVDQFFLWIKPQQLYMLSDLHNMSCRKKKLFNYTHVIPTLEDRMLNRIRIKFHPSRYLFGVDIANLVLLFQRKLAESSALIPFNCDYYYWEYICRKYPNITNINRMLIADDMWLHHVPSAFIELNQSLLKPIRPALIKYEDSLGCISLSSVQFPRKILSCDEENSEHINKINNPHHFSDIQKRYYVLSLIDKAVSLIIDYEIKSRVVSYQFNNNIRTEYSPDQMDQFQASLGEFILKLIPLYPFILNYTQGVDMFCRVFNSLSPVHQNITSRELYRASQSDKIHPSQYMFILNHDYLINIILFGLGHINEAKNHIACFDFFNKMNGIQFYLTIFCWKFLEMILVWLIPYGYSNHSPLPSEYTLKFLCELPHAIDATYNLPESSPKKLIIFPIQQRILNTISSINFETFSTTPIDKKIIYIKDIILNNYVYHKNKNYRHL